MSSVLESIPSRRVRLGTIEPAAVAVLARLDPVIVVLCLFASQGAFGRPVTLPLVYLALLAFIISSPLFGTFDLPHMISDGQTPLSSLPATCSRVLVRWGAIAAGLLFLAYTFDVGVEFSRKVILTWFAITPAALCLSQAARLRASWFAAQMPTRRYIIVGVNDVGLELARRLPAQGFSGYFDFRGPDRVGLGTQTAQEGLMSPVHPIEIADGHEGAASPGGKFTDVLDHDHQRAAPCSRSRDRPVDRNTLERAAIARRSLSPPPEGVVNPRCRWAVEPPAPASGMV